MVQKSEEAIEIGKRLRKLRGIRTRTGLSRELNVPYSTLQSYEDGTRNPPDEFKDKIASYFGVSKESIFCTDK